MKFRPLASGLLAAVMLTGPLGLSAAAQDVPPSVCAGTAAAAMSSVQPEANSETHLRTSYSEDSYVDMTIRGTRLIISGRLKLPGLTSVTAVCDEVRQQVSAVDGRSFSMSLSLSHYNAEPLQLFTGHRKHSSSLPCFPQPPMVEQVGESYRFAPSRVLEDNLSAARPPADSDIAAGFQTDRMIATLSDTVVHNQTDPYTRTFLLYQWVVDNIYLDPQLTEDRPEEAGLLRSAAQVLRTRQGDSLGYADLLAQLLLVQGIPALVSYSLEGQFQDPGAPAGQLHGFVEAWVDGRWVLLDPARDSRNRTHGTSFTKNLTNGYSCFDMTPAFFAQSNQILRTLPGEEAPASYLISTDRFCYDLSRRTLLSWNGTDSAAAVPQYTAELAPGAFRDQTQLSSITLSGPLNQLGREAFRGCTALERISLPAPLASLPQDSFRDGTALTAVDLPDSVGAIKENAFRDCTALTRFHFPARTRLVEAHAFDGCTSLGSVRLPQGLDILPAHLFANCTGLTQVMLPASVTTIEDAAFYRTGLTDVYYGGTPEQWAAVSVGPDNTPLAQARVHFGADLGPKAAAWAAEDVDRTICIGLADTAVLGQDFTLPITREQFASLAVNLCETITGQVKDPASEVFADGTSRELAILYELGVMGGYNQAEDQSQVQMGIREGLTREQAAVILARLSEKLGLPLTAAGELPFTDPISSWALEGIGQVYRAGIMGGCSPTDFGARSGYTIQESAVTMLRALQLLRFGIVPR